ncbi:uncharacterized protein VNE69_09178 [Vairimorpha necatrix]|uniref:Zinc-ribbon 15 domain-containing protein n=1 Tax=Vairimorpha necatrix TaxID=6039 RepID=A0AAX4JFR2_9MICR
MCDPCCLIVGWSPSTKSISQPTGFPDLPDKILCPHCSMVTKAKYKKDDYKFQLCFIPLCTCWSSEAYLACDNCYIKIPMIRGEPCRACHVSRPFDGEYCPNCGTKVGGEARSLNIK